MAGCASIPNDNKIKEYDDDEVMCVMQWINDNKTAPTFDTSLSTASAIAAAAAIEKSVESVVGVGGALWMFRFRAHHISAKRYVKWCAEANRIKASRKAEPEKVVERAMEFCVDNVRSYPQEAHHETCQKPHNPAVPP